MEGAGAGGGAGTALRSMFTPVLMRMLALLVAMRLALDVDAADHDEEAILDAHDFDLRTVEPREHRAGDDLVDRAEHRRAAAQIQHAIDRIDERVELVSAEDDRDLQLVAQTPRNGDDAGLMRGIERDEGFVEQQQFRAAEQRLAEQQALAFPAREFADRAAREIAGADLIQRPVDLAARRLVEPGKPEPRAHRRAGDDIVARQAQPDDRASILRHVADRGVAATERAAQRRDRTRRDRRQAERGAHQSRLAGAIGAEHADELAVLDDETGGRENGAAAEADRRSVELECAQLVAPPSALSSASSWPCIQFW